MNIRCLKCDSELLRFFGSMASDLYYAGCPKCQVMFEIKYIWKREMIRISETKLNFEEFFRKTEEAVGWDWNGG